MNKVVLVHSNITNFIIYFHSQHVVETKPLESDASMKVVKFATTPKMSTYIIAFIVGDYDYVEGKAENDVTVRVYTSAGKSKGGQFALEVKKASRILLRNAE